MRAKGGERREGKIETEPKDLVWKEYTHMSITILHIYTHRERGHNLQAHKR